MSKICSACNTQAPDGGKHCPNCGKELLPYEEATAVEGPSYSPPPPVSQPTQYTPPPPQQPGQSGSNQQSFGSFLSFDVMITPFIMKIIYIVGSAMIILGSLFVMFTAGAIGFFGGLIGGAIALVYYRVVCELLILLFKINGNVNKIKDSFERK